MIKKGKVMERGRIEKREIEVFRAGCSRCYSIVAEIKRSRLSIK